MIPIELNKARTMFWTLVAGEFASVALQLRLVVVEAVEVRGTPPNMLFDRHR